MRKGGGGAGVSQPSSAWVWGRCKPPNGVRGRGPEANAFWQQSIENWLKIRSLGRRLDIYTPNSDPISATLLTAI